MNITDIRIRKLMDSNRMKAVISITIDDMLVVHDIKVIQGEERLFVAMPSRRDELGAFRDVVHPIDSQSRKYLEEAIIKVYEDRMKLLGEESFNQQSSF